MILWDQRELHNTLETVTSLLCKLEVINQEYYMSDELINLESAFVKRTYEASTNGRHGCSNEHCPVCYKLDAPTNGTEIENSELE